MKGQPTCRPIPEKLRRRVAVALRKPARKSPSAITSNYVMAKKTLILRSRKTIANMLPVAELRRQAEERRRKAAPAPTPRSPPESPTEAAERMDLRTWIKVELAKEAKAEAERAKRALKEAAQPQEELQQVAQEEATADPADPARASRPKTSPRIRATQTTVETKRRAYRAGTTRLWRFQPSPEGRDGAEARRDQIPEMPPREMPIPRECKEDLLVPEWSGTLLQTLVWPTEARIWLGIRRNAIARGSRATGLTLEGAVIPAEGAEGVPEGTNLREIFPMSLGQRVILSPC